MRPLCAQRHYTAERFRQNERYHKKSPQKHKRARCDPHLVYRSNRALQPDRLQPLRHTPRQSPCSEGTRRLALCDKRLLRHRPRHRCKRQQAHRGVPGPCRPHSRRRHEGDNRLCPQPRIAPVYLRRQTRRNQGLRSRRRPQPILLSRQQLLLYTSPALRTINQSRLGR